VICERHACKSVEALGEGEVLRKGCDDVGSSHLVQNIIGFAQEVRKSLAVFAIADPSTHVFREADVASQSSTSTSQWMIRGSTYLNVVCLSHAV
jgi:hypothetical protein